MIRKMFRSIGLVSISAFVVLILAASAASAATYVYKNTLTRLNGNTAYGIGLMMNVVENRIWGCEYPTWSASIYLTTTGGTQIRTKTGVCTGGALAYAHAPESSVNVWCKNNTSIAKFGTCQVIVN